MPVINARWADMLLLSYQDGAARLRTSRRAVGLADVQ
jgi:hypothetical protein